MKKIILPIAWIIVNVTSYAQTTAQKPAASVSFFADVENVFMFIAILIVTAFVLIPIYSLSHAVKVLAKKVGKN